MPMTEKAARTVANAMKRGPLHPSLWEGCFFAGTKTAK